MDSLYYLFVHNSMYIIYAVLTVVIIKFLFGKTPKDHHSNWSTMIGDFNFPVEDFYKLIKEELKVQKIQGLTFKHINMSDGIGALNKREYLRIYWKDFYYDLGAMPFGNNNLYISWWLIYDNSLGRILISKIPFIGEWLVNKLYKITYHKVNSASAFMTLAQSSVQNVIKQITEGKGVTLDIDTKPVMNDIFKR